MLGRSIHYSKGLIMTKRVIVRRPMSGSIPDLAGAHLFKSGPLAQVDLFVAVDFGAKPHLRQAALDRGISSGWLIENLAGKIDCGSTARAHYAEQAEEAGEVKTVGQITPAQYRQNVFASPGLSKKYLTNSRGTRPGTEYAHRPAGFGFKSIAGGANNDAGINRSIW
jgi:hypothetical protein